MQRASYTKAVEWIALNDEPEDLLADNIAGYISATLVADIFGVSSERVASDIVAYRMNEGTPSHD